MKINGYYIKSLVAFILTVLPILALSAEVSIIIPKKETLNIGLNRL